MKYRFLCYLRRSVQRCALFALMLLLTLCAYFYAQGYFDFTFIKRVTPGSVSTEAAEISVETAAATEDDAGPAADTESVTLETGVVTEAETEAVADSGSVIPASGPQTTETRVTARSFSQDLATVKEQKAAGYVRMTSGTYSVWKTVIAKLGLTAPNTYSSSTYNARSLLVTEYERGCVLTTETTEETARPTVQLKNGFIILDNGSGSLSLLRADGTLFLAEYDDTTFVLSDLRDASGNALFYSVSYVTDTVHLPITQPNEYTGLPEETGFYEEEETEVTREVREYYYLSEDNRWVRSDYKDSYTDGSYDDTLEKELDCGVNFDAPTDFGATDCDLERYYTGYKWGYRSVSTGQTVIYPRFTAAYNPQNGYAVAFDDYYMYVIDSEGNIISQQWYDKPEVFVTNNELTIPDTFGIESLGTFYFSHGWTRVRIRENLKTYKYYNYIKSADYSTLMDVNGNLFDIPKGYTLVSYSDGVMLLQRTGEELYGYMNYKGEWIAQPVYTYARPFISGLAALGYADGKQGMIDTDGNFVIPLVYESVSDLSSGMVAVYSKTLGWDVLWMSVKG